MKTVYIATYEEAYYPSICVTVASDFTRAEEIVEKWWNAWLGHPSDYVYLPLARATSDTLWRMTIPNNPSHFLIEQWEIE